MKRDVVIPIHKIGLFSNIDQDFTRFRESVCTPTHSSASFNHLHILP